MAARVGQVLYWIGCGIAVLLLVPSGCLVVTAVDHGLSSSGWFFLVLTTGAAVLAWAIGRALLYILAGR